MFLELKCQSFFLVFCRILSPGAVYEGPRVYLRHFESMCEECIIPVLRKFTICNAEFLVAREQR